MITANIEAFKKQHKLTRVVFVNLTSTERYTEVEDVHKTLAAFEAGLDANDARISPAMKYLYVACSMGIPHVNFTPSLSKIPALEEMSEKRGVPIAGEDGKTGQTMLKTVLAPGFVVRALEVEGWYSANILGNNDGLVLDDPGSNKTKVSSKAQCLDDILGYAVPSHTVRIDYYKPRGDQKEAWDFDRSDRLPRRAHAVEDQLLVQGLDPRGAARVRPRSLARCRQAQRRARHPAPAVGVLQGAVRDERRARGPRPVQAAEPARDVDPEDPQRREERCSARPHAADRDER